MLNLDRMVWRQEPYQIGSAQQVFDPATYEALVKAFPTEGFKDIVLENGTKKTSLSVVNNKELYKEFLASCPPWQKFHDYIKSHGFLRTVVGLLVRDRIGTSWSGTYTSRFEFSAMPADGGCLPPHTDIVSKVVTIVIPMMAPGYWNPAWGGGTDILKPKGDKVLQDYKAGLDEFDKIHTYECIPNQAVLFVKTHNSWHSVGPCTGPPEAQRRTITINIESIEKWKKARAAADGYERA